MSLVTPLLFSTIQPQLYRGSQPREINIPFLKMLNLNYIVSLTSEPLGDDPTMLQFCHSNGISILHIPCQDDKQSDKKKKKLKEEEDNKKSEQDKGEKEVVVVKVKRKKRHVPIDYDVVERCVKFLVDKRHYPCYIHCSSGELITSLVVACLRKFSYWSTVSILNEFLVYNSSINIHERNFIENFNSEIEVENLKLIDKVPWISIQYLSNVDTKSSKKEVDNMSHMKTATTVSIRPNNSHQDSIPKGLPKLKFHSL
ncbi:protein-tyrosine-phosphatase NDAI_0A03700 [Naumovozyma dairenensis CBS 421]|uniref:Tyrosine-protein phosphatase domain-containing protein n=1 Tax=Naumovozyma dairenensis (strain ATCC 10597 / BCRC 20456 / CBS 421 / NBRC 0211 / NRRL Y-12639) TaxID=1071378 RepID=G0W3Y9_NAUDC|nr:hypothetical protein NDAI_0A03700 [Naumovozyma dairenensis CBS 421]CCD22527.1 hypothetical protein NDAI_0A03700 [Naumovozyma dairenensis CBS 421]